MNNILKRFYFLSKLTTSLILFFTLIFLAYLFLKAYLLENNSSNSTAELRTMLETAEDKRRTREEQMQQMQELQQLARAGKDVAPLASGLPEDAQAVAEGVSEQLAE